MPMSRSIQKQSVLYSLICLPFLFSAGCVAKQAKDIEGALVESRMRPPFDIKIAQRKSGIYLDGYVSRPSDKQEAIAIAQHHAGRRNVFSHIHIHSEEGKARYSPHASLQSLKESISTIAQSYEGKGLEVTDISIAQDTISVSGDANNFMVVDEFLSRVRNVTEDFQVESLITVNGKEYMSLWGKYSASVSAARE